MDMHKYSKLYRCVQYIPRPVPDYPLGTEGTCLKAPELRGPSCPDQTHKETKQKVKREISVDIVSNWCSLLGMYDICLLRLHVRV
jgi:hypothetical protein